MSLFNPLELVSDRPGPQNEQILYGRVLDPGKFPDPLLLGRVKVRVPELHGLDGAVGIPDEDLPWCQLERNAGHGTQQEMSAFHMPQNDAIVKTRWQATDPYSPLISGAPYTVDGPITEFGGAIPTGETDFTNQHKHYGYKDPLGGLIHFDMDKKEIWIDWTFYKRLHIKWPKTDIQVLNTYNDDSYPPDGYSGSGWGDYGGGGEDQGIPDEIEPVGSTKAASATAPAESGPPLEEIPMGEEWNTPPESSGGGGGLVPGECPQTAMDPQSLSGPGEMIPGDINWIIEGYYDKQVHETYNKHVFKDACETYDMNFHTTVGYDWIISVGGNVTFTIGGSLSLSTGAEAVVAIGGSYTESSGYRNTSVGAVWDATAEPSYWPWLSVGYSDESGHSGTSDHAGYADTAGSCP